MEKNYLIPNFSQKVLELFVTMEVSFINVFQEIISKHFVVAVIIWKNAIKGTVMQIKKST